MGRPVPRRLVAILFTLAAYAGTAATDQHAPALDALFAELTRAADAETASEIEAQIWTFWLAAPSPEAGRLLEQARATANAGDSDTALALFNRLTERFPDYAEGWNQRAILHYLLGNIQGSLDDIARTLELEPRHFGALAGRGQCYLRLDRPQESLTAFEASLRINPWSVEVLQQVEVLRGYLRDRLTPI